MQQVYRATDLAFERSVALKVPKNPSAEKRFARSARVSARINHPNIAKTLDFFEDVGRNYLVGMIFLAAIPGVGTSRSVAASSTSGQMALAGIGDGVLPFSPDAHDVNDPNFGFLLGKPYTLRWGKVVGNPPQGTYLTSINGQKLIGCQGDMDVPAFQPGETSASQRGYVDLSNLDPIDAGGGASLIRER